MSKFLVCKHCGNVAKKVVDKGVPIICCGEPMEAMVPGSVDAAQEKHVPEVEIDGDKVTVKVGSVEHPMLEEHFIQFIYVETENGGQKKVLKPGMKPEAVFNLVDDKAVAVYEFCNLHGLWKKDL